MKRDLTLDEGKPKMSHSTGLIILAMELKLHCSEEFLNTWLLGLCSLGERLQDSSERENLIFSVEQMSLDYINILPCLIELRFIYLGGCQNCWIENSSAEVSFRSLSSVKYYKTHIPKLIISRSPVL